MIMGMLGAQSEMKPEDIEGRIGFEIEQNEEQLFFGTGKGPCPTSSRETFYFFFLYLSS